jgi:hypothetical protein
VGEGATEKAKKTREAKARAMWDGLNDRQRAYPKEAYHLDRKAEERARSAWSWGELGERRLPPGTLREWHWRALARAYAAGAEGVEISGAGYGRIGWRTWLRLIGYSNKATGYGGLVEEQRAAPTMEHRVFLTDDGLRFYRELWAAHGVRYPDAETPDPGVPAPPAPPGRESVSLTSQLKDPKSPFGSSTGRRRARVREAEAFELAVFSHPEVVEGFASDRPSVEVLVGRRV